MCFAAPAIFLLHANGPVLPQQLAKFEVGGDSGERYQIRFPFIRGVDEAVTSEGRCEVVHIAMVISDSGIIQRVLFRVKSILFYRQNPLHFHFLLYPRSKEIVSTIFKTWQLPEVNVSFYSLSNAIDATKWMPNFHSSTRYALAKLTFVNVLPSSLKAVIVLDTDLMLASDIGKLWTYVGHLHREKKKYGLVENQYLDTIWEDYPVAGRGYNAKVILLNLELLRATDWSKAWQSYTRVVFKTHSEVPFSDENVINAVIAKEKGTVLVLPCVWNVQLSENLSEYCIGSVYDFKIVHWNLYSSKFDVNNIYWSRFKSLHQMFRDFDSMLFRTYYTNCSAPSRPKTANSKERNDPCYDLRLESKLVRKVHPYYLNYSYQSTSDNDVTLVTHAAMDRLHMLESVCNHWGGPLSVALYASDADLDELTAHISSSPVLRDNKKLALHVVSKSGKFYPYNQLRNIALDFVKTPYVYMIDIDFLPMYGLYEYAKEAVTFLEDRKRALIVPAFETFRFEMNFPDDKSHLLSLLQEGTVFPFRIHAWKGGHAPTNYQYWKTAKRPYSVQWAKGFEPYFIMSSSVPRFDERFIGYGGDKISHVMELVAQGYELVVLPKAFMIHMPHPVTRERTVFKQKSNQYRCIKMLQEEFAEEIHNAH